MKKSRGFRHAFVSSVKVSVWSSNIEQDHASPLLPLNLSGKFGGKVHFDEGGRQRAELGGRRLLGLVYLQDLFALGEALRCGDETPQPSGQHRRGWPVRSRGRPKTRGSLPAI